MKKIVIAAHVMFLGEVGVHGPAHAVSDYLKRKGERHVFIQHPLTGNHSTFVDDICSEKTERKTLNRSPVPFFPIRILLELKNNLRFFKKNSCDIFIGVDPLNAFAGLLAKKQGVVKKVIFYTADYAIQRFQNPFINAFYHWIDRYCIKNADIVWNVSTRITRRRAEQGVPEEKNFFIPNSPEFIFIERLPLEEIRRYDLTIVANLIQAIDYPLIIKTVEKLLKEFPQLRLLIIGDGERREFLEKFVQELRLNEYILFLGKKSREEVLKILSYCGIGLAIYTNDCSWTEFGDSKKAREYLACGLPTIITKVVSTADDIAAAEAGFVIELTEEDLYAAIKKLLVNDRLYRAMRERAIKTAEKYDLNKILDKAFLYV